MKFKIQREDGVFVEMTHEDLGLTPHCDAMNERPFLAYVSRFTWDGGELVLHVPAALVEESVNYRVARDDVGLEDAGFRPWTIKLLG